MTAIVGLVHNGIVHLGGDSAGVSGYSFTTSFRMGQLLRWSFEAPEQKDDLERFMSTVFIDTVRETLKTGGWLKKDSERDEGGTFLVGVAGRLFRVESDFQVGEAADGFDATGCGFDIALGALHATARTRIGPQRRLRLALEAAERFSAGVRGPFAYADTSG